MLPAAAGVLFTRRARARRAAPRRTNLLQILAFGRRHATRRAACFSLPASLGRIQKQYGTETAGGFERVS